jgi:hypothetical protein
MVWHTVLNCGGVKCNRIAGSISCVCAYFVAAVLSHVICTREKKRNGFTDDCKYEFVYSPRGLVVGNHFEITGKVVGVL